MNRTGHALSGVAAGLWTLPVAPVEGVAGSFVWVAATTGFALASDLDHPGSTAARMWGPVSRLPAKGIGSVFGHRGATHQLLAVAVTVAFVWAATTGRVAALVTEVAARAGHDDPAGLGHDVGHWTHLAVVAATVGLALTAARVPWVMNLTLAWLAAWLVWRLNAPLGWLPWAAGLGVAAHIAGDAVTVQGLPGRGGQRVGPRLFRTGGPGEAIVCILLTAAIAAYPYRGVLAAYLQGVIT